MPENHKTVYGWSSERFLSGAEKTGPHTKKYISRILESREYPVQTYDLHGHYEICQQLS